MKGDVVMTEQLLNTYEWMFLRYHLNEPDQVLPLRWLQLRHHRSEVAQVTVDAVRLSRVD